MAAAVPGLESLWVMETPRERVLGPIYNSYRDNRSTGELNQVLTLLPRLRYFSGGPLGAPIGMPQVSLDTPAVFPSALKVLFLTIPSMAFPHPAMEMVARDFGAELEVLCVNKFGRLDANCLQLVGELKHLIYLSVGLPQNILQFDATLTQLPRLKGISLAGLDAHGNAAKGTEFGTEDFVPVLERVIERVPNLVHLTVPKLCQWQGSLAEVMRMLGELKKLRSLHLLCSFDRGTMCPKAGSGQIVMVEVSGRGGGIRD